MLSKEDAAAAGALLDKRRLQELGVLLPIRLSALAFFSGRHPLGRAGEGMRFLRTRPFESGQDNPRDIDKFSPPGEYWINEWEAEAQANVMIYADVSASMQFGPKASLLNLTLLQLTYSLWRASDRVRTTLFSGGQATVVARRNLKSQLEHLIVELGKPAPARGRDVTELLAAESRVKDPVRTNLAFVVSDFVPVERGRPLPPAEQWRSAIRRLRCDVVPVVITFELPAGQRGAIRLHDPERDAERLTLLTPTRIREINTAERRRVGELKKTFRQAGLDHLVLAREHDVYPELARLATWRRRRRG